MRTEEEVLKDFKKLGYKITSNDEVSMYLEKQLYIIRVFKISKCYDCQYKYSSSSFILDLEDHKLLHELFEIWRWLE